MIISIFVLLQVFIKIDIIIDWINYHKIIGIIKSDKMDLYNHYDDLAKKHIQNAEKLQKLSFFEKIFSQKPDYDEISNNYSAAANCMMLIKKYETALTYYLLAIDAFDKSEYKSAIGTALLYMKAYNCNTKIKGQEISSKYIQDAINICLENNLIDYAYKFQKELAELYETHGMIHEAIDAYNKLIEFADLSDYNNRTVQLCQEKLGDMCIKIGDIEEAVSIFNNVLSVIRDEPMYHFKTRKIFFKVALATIYLNKNDLFDMQELKHELDEFCKKDPSFINSSEGKLLESIYNNEINYENSAKLYCSSHIYNVIEKKLIELVLQKNVKIMDKSDDDNYDDLV